MWLGYQNICSLVGVIFLGKPFMLVQVLHLSATYKLWSTSANQWVLRTNSAQIRHIRDTGRKQFLSLTLITRKLTKLKPKHLNILLVMGCTLGINSFSLHFFQLLDVASCVWFQMFQYFLYETSRLTVNRLTKTLNERPNN